MRRTYIGLLLAAVVAIPGLAAGTYYGMSDNAVVEKPCFIAGNAGYKLSTYGDVSHIVRIDNHAATPHLRMQLVDNPAAADFVLVDDSDATVACKGASIIESIRIDPAAAKPDLVVAVSRDAADYKIYLHSDNYNEQDAAALAAVIWQNASKARALRTATR